MQRVVAAAGVRAEWGNHLRVAVGVRVPDREHAHRVRGEAHEAAGGRVVGGAGLAGQVPAHRQGLGAGPVLDRALHGLGHQGGVVRREDPFGLRLGLVHVLAVVVRDVGDDMHRRLDALVGDGGIGLGQLGDVHAVVAQHGEGVLARDALGADARLVGRLRDRRRTEILLQLHIDGIDGIRRGAVHIDIAVTHVREVLHRRRYAVVCPWGVAVEGGVEAHALLHRREEGEGFHRRTRLVDGLGGIVELFGEIVVAAVDRYDPAGSGVKRDAAHLQAFGDGALAVLRRARHPIHLVLLGLVDGGDDAVSAGVEILLAEGPVLGQLLAHHLHEVPRRPREGVLLPGLDGLGNGGGGGVLRGNVAVLLHDPQHAVEADAGLLRTDGRVPIRRRGDDAGQERRLLEAQILGVLAEVRLCGGLDAVGSAAKVDRVHVVAQHLVLVLRLRDLERQERLVQFARI